MNKACQSGVCINMPSAKITRGIPLWSLGDHSTVHSEIGSPSAASVKSSKANTRWGLVGVRKNPIALNIDCHPCLAVNG